jgi:hypothetical protein
MNTATGFRQGNLPGKVPDHTHNDKGKRRFFQRPLDPLVMCFEYKSD